MVVDDVVQNPQKSNEYEYEKKHVRRESKMCCCCCCCCCCCRFCCGAPTTDERIHAPVLHDASQIAYCRYWGRASLPPITSMVFVYNIYDIVADTQFHKFHGRPSARVLHVCITHERYRSVTPLGTTRVNRTILQGRCCPQPFCARILYNPHRGRGKICMILLHVKHNTVKQKLSKKCHPYDTRIGSGYISYEMQFFDDWWDEQNRCTYIW